MRPVIAMLALLLALSACTIREETFAPKDEGQSNAFSFGARDMNGPAERDSSSCPGGFARGPTCRPIAAVARTSSATEQVAARLRRFRKCRTPGFEWLAE